MKLSTAKKRAWDACSEWTRRKDADEGGFNECYTCGVIKYWKGDGLQAGHGISGRGNAILFEDDVLKPQCFSCNIGKYGNYEVFVPKLIRELGLERYEELQRNKNRVVKRKSDDYLNIESEYKEKLNDLI